MQLNEIKWGSYKSWEGPYYPGHNKFVLSSNPSDEEKFLSVITATEGGCLDAVNMYDSCVLSSGIIQWCEAHFLVSNMLGYLAEKDPSLLSPLDPALRMSGACFKRRQDGKWRFFFSDARGEVNSTAKQQALFFGSSTGAKGSWNAASTLHAKTWALCVASVWDSPIAKAAQIEFTAARLGMFLTKDSKTLLFGPNTPGNDGFVGALRAAYYSFAANLPAVASEQLRLATSQSNAAIWSEAWVVEVLKHLTFGPKIPIYPGRYDKIRPVIESLYDVDLPDFSKDLAQWRSEIETNPVPGMIPDFVEVDEVQEELIAEGYDLGPRGADGTYGAKTKQAVRDFQSAHGLGIDGILGTNTRKALVDAYLKRVSNV